MSTPDTPSEWDGPPPPMDLDFELPSIDGYEQTKSLNTEYLPPPSEFMMVDRPPAVNPSFGTTMVQLSESEVREALLEYVQQGGCCWGTGAAKKLAFDRVLPGSGLDYKLETFGESRSVGWKFVPYTGQPIDGPENGKAPHMWDIPVQFQQLFQNQVEYREIPHTAYVKDCGTCHATGKVTCSTCSGSGRNRCNTCYGSGRVTRTVMRNKRSHLESRTCGYCHGSGHVTCSRCHGSGRITCPTCRGHCKLKGYLNLTVNFTNHIDHHVTERSDLPDHLIVDAVGQSLFTFQADRVGPVFEFPDPDMVEGSKRVVDDHIAKYIKTERVHQQRHGITQVPVTECQYRWKDQNYRYWVYGENRRVYCNPEYPQTCCWGCTML